MEKHMMKSRQRLPWILFVSAISGTAAAQNAPVAPAAPQPAATAQAAATPAPEQPAPNQPPPASAAEPVPEPPHASFPPIDPPPPPASAGRARDGNVGRLTGGLTWNVGVPLGSVRDFTSNASAAGLGLLLKYWVHPRIAI